MAMRPREFSKVLAKNAERNDSRKGLGSISSLRGACWLHTLVSETHRVSKGAEGISSQAPLIKRAWFDIFRQKVVVVSDNCEELLVKQSSGRGLR